MTVAIIDYGSGNLRSAAKAFERAAQDIGLGREAVFVTRDPEVVLGADRLVLPGVGAFGDCCQGLAALDGMIEALREVALHRARPFLGICVGMQLLADTGIEHGKHQGLGWIPGEVVPIKPKDDSYKIPHMGWNDLILTASGKDHPLFARLGSEPHAYFVHSYHFVPVHSQMVLAEVEYGGPMTAVIGAGNVIGTQFHPEKSQDTGVRFLANFMRWRP